MEVNLFYDQIENYFEYKDLKVFNLGSFIYKKHLNQQALKIFTEDYIKNNDLKKTLLSDQIKGQFCLFILENDKLKIITDKLGYFPFYFYQNKECLELSNSMIVLAQNNTTTLSLQGVAEYFSENYKYLTHAACPNNIWKEIKYTNPGTIYTISNYDPTTHQ